MKYHEASKHAWDEMH